MSDLPLPYSPALTSDPRGNVYPGFCVYQPHALLYSSTTYVSILINILYIFACLYTLRKQ